MAKRNKEEPQTFEEALRKLEAIAHDLEEGEIGLEESLQQFEQGIGLLRFCYGVLDAAEKRIELLTGHDAEGNPILEEFDATATAVQETVGRRKAGNKLRSKGDRTDGGATEDVSGGRELF